MLKKYSILIILLFLIIFWKFTIKVQGTETCKCGGQDKCVELICPDACKEEAHHKGCSNCNLPCDCKYELECYTCGSPNTDNNNDEPPIIIPTEWPEPTEPPEPTSPPGPTNTPKPTNTPAPTATPAPPTATPTITPIPGTPTPTIYLVAMPTQPAGFAYPFSFAHPSQTWKCLKSEYYDGPVTPGGKTDHRLKVSGNTSDLPQTIYIVGCLGDKCTSGDTNLDKQISLEKDPSHFFNVNGGNPYKIPSGSNTFEVIVYSHSINFTTHTFFAVSTNDPSLVNDGQAGSIQYGSFQFKQDATKCTAIRWDPYGRVFDDQTLQPIGNIKISLLNKDKQLVKLPGLINPARTDSLGVYSFLVGEGEYYLSVEPPQGYEFIKNPILNPNYVKYYRNIYKPEELIVEEPGKIELRDIPLTKVNPNTDPVLQIIKQILSFWN